MLDDQGAAGIRRAVEWLGRCLEFGAGARLGEDTSQAHVAMAEALLGLGERERASEMVTAAREAAEKAGNQLDLGSAIAVMAAVLEPPRFSRHGTRPIRGALPQRGG